MTAPTMTLHELQQSWERVLVAGNHLASALVNAIGADPKHFPSYQTEDYVARVLLGQETFDVWICWATIMRERDRLEALEAA